MARSRLTPLLKVFILIASVVFLSACSTGNDHVDGPLTPLPADYQPPEPEDDVLLQAIKEYLAAVKGPAFSRYDFTRVDLDGDKRRDALVMMKGPHTYWCGLDGCSLMVFKAHDDYFTVASQIFPVRGPLYVSDLTNEGWRNLIVRVSGQPYAPAKDVALHFDGSQYPRNPFFEPGIQLSQADQGLRLFP